LIVVVFKKTHIEFNTDSSDIYKKYQFIANDHYRIDGNYSGTWDESGNMLTSNFLEF